MVTGKLDCQRFQLATAVAVAEEAKPVVVAVGVSKVAGHEPQPRESVQKDPSGCLVDLDSPSPAVAAAAAAAAAAVAAASVVHCTVQTWPAAAMPPAVA